MTVSAARVAWRRVALGTLQLVIVVGICWALFRNVDVQQLIAALRRAAAGPLIVAVLALFIERIVRPYRLFRLLGGRIALSKVIALQNASQLVNLVLPLRSGEMLLVVALRSLGSSGSFALSIVTIDRLMDVVCVLLVFALVLIAALGLPSYVGQAAVLLTVLCAIAVVGMIALALARSKAILLIDRILARVMGPARAARWSQRFELVFEGFAVLLEPSRLVPAVLATLVTWASAILAAWLVFTAIWPDAPLAAAALAICLSAIGVTLVSVPAGIGIVHGAYTLAAVAFGASQEVGLAFAILGHFLAMAVTIVMGLYGLAVAKRLGMTLARRSANRRLDARS